VASTRDWASDLSKLGRIAFDTNALIYLLEGQEPHVGRVAEALWRVERGLAVGVVSTIVEMEVLVRPIRDQRFDVVERVDMLFRNVRTLLIREVDRTVARLAAGLRARTNLKTPDALIAATAVAEGCDAIIGNDQDFAVRVQQDIPYLRLDDYV
jgi:predicted nucleic acid-binding protein